jgi:hypothetical protein
MRDLGAVDTSTNRSASTARGQFRERIEALGLAQHTSHRALLVTVRAEVEYNRLVRSRGEDLVALSGLLSVGETTLVAILVVIVALVVIIIPLLVLAIAILVLITAGCLRRMSGGAGGWLGAAALDIQLPFPALVAIGLRREVWVMGNTATLAVIPRPVIRRAFGSAGRASRGLGATILHATTAILPPELIAVAAVLRKRATALLVVPVVAFGRASRIAAFVIPRIFRDAEPIGLVPIIVLGAGVSRFRSAWSVTPVLHTATLLRVEKVVVGAIGASFQTGVDRPRGRESVGERSAQSNHNNCRGEEHGSVGLLENQGWLLRSWSLMVIGRWRHSETRRDSDERA